MQHKKILITKLVFITNYEELKFAFSWTGPLPTSTPQRRRSDKYSKAIQSERRRNNCGSTEDWSLEPADDGPFQIFVIELAVPALPEALSLLYSF